MAVVALLLSLALPRYTAALDHSKEVVLRENLQILRANLDRFFADKGRYPETLEELVEQRYLRAVPVDPITESASTWVTRRSDDPDVKGIHDVKSGATGVARDGRRYDSM